ncbi:MAG: glycoside hydrolase family 25 protein [Clostridia bacterium]
MKKTILIISIILILVGASLVLVKQSNFFSTQKDQESVTVTATPTPTPTPTDVTTQDDSLITAIPIVEEDFAYNQGVLTYADSEVGIDVSGFQGDIDWEKVKQDGIDFAIIRVGYRGATVGNIAEDKYFEQNISGAIDAGIKVGVYFYSQAITAQEAIEEANYVLEKISDYDLTYPVFFDWEYTNYAESRVTEITSEDVTTFANEFLNVIADAGYITGVYINDDQMEDFYDLGVLASPYKWYAYYDGIPSLECEFDLLQHSCTGTVNGIDSDVDLNISFVIFD